MYIWKSYIPLKLSIFVWKLWNKGVQIDSRIKRCSIPLVKRWSFICLWRFSYLFVESCFKKLWFRGFNRFGLEKNVLDGGIGQRVLARSTFWQIVFLLSSLGKYGVTEIRGSMKIFFYLLKVCYINVFYGWRIWIYLFTLEKFLHFRTLWLFLIFPSPKSQSKLGNLSQSRRSRPFLVINWTLMG